MYLKSIILVIAFFFFYYEILVDLVADWYNDDNYSHGFIVPFVSAYLIWERKSELKSLAVKPSLAGLFLLLFGIIVCLSGHIGAEYFLMRSSILFVLSGLVLFLLGKSYLKLLAFPIGFLIFMIPLPAIVFNAIAFPLQLFAAKVSTNVILILGIPVFRDGNIIHLAQTTLEVAEACSGIRSLITILTLATIYAYFMEIIRWKQALIVFSAIPIAIITNSLRVTVTAFLAHHYGSEAADGFYHTFEGWFMFVVASVILIIFGSLLSKVFRKNI